MTYTVKQLATQSGVSVRALHWYDEIGLLQPSVYGANGYRYYEEAQLLLLQQILFFRELGFPLHDIQKLLAQNDAEKTQALRIQRLLLVEKIDRQKALLETIDKTILHFGEKDTMNTRELTESEKNLWGEIKYRGLAAEDLLFASEKCTKQWSQQEWDAVREEGDAVHKALAAAIHQGLEPASHEVQRLIQRHYQAQGRFFDMTKEIYIGLSELYEANPDFKTFFDAYHADLIPFMGEAMRVYAHQNL